MIVAGLGCRPGCDPAHLVALVRRAETEAGCRATLLAAPEFRADAAHAVSAALGLRLVLLDRAALLAAQPRCTTRSAVAERATGLASVAEGSALAAIGPAGRLLLPRRAAAGATCALATDEPAEDGPA